MLIKDTSDVQKFSTDLIVNKIIYGDAFVVLDKIEESSIDMVFLDPPYFLQIGKNKSLKRWGQNTLVKPNQESWDSFSSFSEYDSFIYALLEKIRKVMKPDATLWVIATYHSIFRIGKILQDLGFWILNDIIWVKTNSMPNFLQVRFSNATETLIWSVKDKNCKSYTFNKEYAKQFGIGKTASNVWVFPICRGNERLKDEHGKTLHPTQKPIELLKRIILVSTHKDYLILDPMAGTGTTGIVAKMLNRNFIMIEREEKYVKAILRRFERMQKVQETFLT